MILIAVLLLVSLAATIVGFAFTGLIGTVQRLSVRQTRLIWLALIGLALFVATSAISYLRRETLRH